MSVDKNSFMYSFTICMLYFPHQPPTHCTGLGLQYNAEQKW